jgi:hypothetical protein
MNIGDLFNNELTGIREAKFTFLIGFVVLAIGIGYAEYSLVFKELLLSKDNVIKDKNETIETLKQKLVDAQNIGPSSRPPAEPKIAQPKTERVVPGTRAPQAPNSAPNGIANSGIIGTATVVNGPPAANLQFSEEITTAQFDSRKLNDNSIAIVVNIPSSFLPGQELVVPLRSPSDAHVTNVGQVR